MEAVAPAAGSMYMDATRLRVAANDPGRNNNALCIVELIGVSHIIGISGPRTRTAIPRFIINAWNIMDLDVPVPDDATAQDPQQREPGRLHELQRFMTREQNLGSNMPVWRRHLAHQMRTNWRLLYETYPCPMTGRDEVPVIAGENQLDIDADARHQEDIAELNKRLETLRVMLAVPAISTQLTPEQREAITFLIDNKKVTMRNPNEFNAATMYTLSQVLTGVVEALDQERHLNRAWRLVINAAKKHAIASDRTLSYYMRKKRAVEKVRWLLEKQRDSPDITPAERENGTRWLRFLDHLEARGQKLDDLADALLLAIETAMRIHKKWYKSIVNRDGVTPVPLCYRPVTNADIEAARAAGTLAVDVDINKAPPVPRKYARKKKVLPAPPLPEPEYEPEIAAPASAAPAQGVILPASQLRRVFPRKAEKKREKKEKKHKEKKHKEKDDKRGKKRKRREIEASSDDDIESSSESTIEVVTFVPLKKRPRKE